MISFESLDTKSTTLLIRDLLNNAYRYSLVEYQGLPNDAPDLWQGYPVVVSDKVACEIKTGSISQNSLLNEVINKCNTILNARQYDILILVVLRELTAYEKERLNQDIKVQKLREFRILDADSIRKLIFENPRVSSNYFNNFNTWHEAYNHIAKLLSDFYEKSPEEPAQFIYQKLKSTDYYLLNSDRIFQYDPKENQAGLDPIQIFASFNYTGIRNDSRVKNINYLLLALESEIVLRDDIVFQGIPSPIITQIIYNRKIDIQNEVWRTFYQINKFGMEGLDEESYNSYNKWYGVGLTAFTIFLFWTNSDLFIPLDQNTSTFIVGLRIVDSIPKSYKDYIKLCTRIKKHSDKDSVRLIVKEAYDFVPTGSSQPSEQLVQLLGKLFAPTDVKAEIVLEDYKHYSNQNFKIIGIRPTKCGEKNLKAKTHQKNLVENNLYLLYDSYEIDQEDIIRYTPSTEEHLFNESGLRISISAIVGENGSGKSTLMELLVLGINSLAKSYKLAESESLIEEEVFVDLFIKTDFIYKISINEQIKIWRYTFDKSNNQFLPAHLIVSSAENIGNFDFKSFFYTIFSNYSLYAFNSNIMGDWIDRLFEKNDGYQIPIVLNPKREEGIINVNLEEGLSRARLLANLMEPSRLDTINKKIPALIHDKRPIALELTIDQSKRNLKREKYLNRIELTQEDRDKIEKVVEFFELDNRGLPDASEDVKEYIYFKLISMSGYVQFIEYKDIYKKGKFDLSKLGQYIKTIIEDKSHVSFKIKQAINYLKYGQYKVNETNITYDCAQKIQQIQQNSFEESVNGKRNIIKTIELMPPSVFNTRLLFDEPHYFEKLSSGEKQQILSIVGITYHLANLDSIQQKENIINYDRVNIVFDEVELYFHPDMQRKYIKDLTDSITSLNLENIKNINIIFVTHSPFILSDVPTLNLLKLKRGVPQLKEGQTFGANIYDLLKDSFFLENGPMGDYAKFKINKTIQWINDDNRDLLEKDHHKEIIYLIGEPILQRKLSEMYDEVTMERTTAEIIKRKISLLEEELKKSEK